MKHFLLSEKEESFVAKRLLVKVNEADNVAIAVKEMFHFSLLFFMVLSYALTVNK